MNGVSGIVPRRFFFGGVARAAGVGPPSVRRQRVGGDKVLLSAKKCGESVVHVGGALEMLGNPYGCFIGFQGQHAAFSFLISEARAPLVARVTLHFAASASWWALWRVRRARARRRCVCSSAEVTELGLSAK